MAYGVAFRLLGHKGHLGIKHAQNQNLWYHGLPYYPYPLSAWRGEHGGRAPAEPIRVRVSGLGF